MDIRAMKNMVVLKNLPSNIVEEAFIVLKKNVKIHKSEVLENNKKSKTIAKNCDQSDFVIKEAELVLQEYIDKIEIKNSLKNLNYKKEITKKYNKLKMLTCFMGVYLIISTILNLIKW